MSDDSDASRDAIHAALQEHGSLGRTGALLTGWVVVTSWVDGEGEPWLAKAHSANVPIWTAQGMHHEALYGAWPRVEDEL